QLAQRGNLAGDGGIVGAGLAFGIVPADIDAGLHGAADIGSPAVPDHEDIAPRRISQPGEGDIEVFAGWFGETDLLGDDDLGNVAAKRGAGDASARDYLQAVG